MILIIYSFEEIWSNDIFFLKIPIWTEQLFGLMQRLSINRFAESELKWQIVTFYNPKKSITLIILHLTGLQGFSLLVNVCN